MISSDGLEQLSKALKDPLKKKIIAKDETIIGALVLVLSDSDKKVVVEALNVLLSLAAPVENRSFLYEFIGMVEQLTSLADTKNPLDHIRELSSQLLQRLKSEHHAARHQPEQLKMRDSNTVTHSSRPAAKTFNKPFLNTSRCKTINLQIEGLHDKNDMEICRERLLVVKGVVSITFDLSKHRSIIRVKPEVTPQTLANAIYQTNTMIAKQVVRTELGEERVLDLHEDQLADKENCALPAYLSDDESPVKVDDKAVRRFGHQEEAREGSWLGAAATFLAKSFYW